MDATVNVEEQSLTIDIQGATPNDVLEGDATLSASTDEGVTYDESHCLDTGEAAEEAGDGHTSGDAC